MDIAQLKLHAARLRTLLEQANHAVGHSQSLDLIAAVPGLRNWPEVQGFPSRVAACELDLTAAGRLAVRLGKKLEVNISPQKLLAELVLPGAPVSTATPQIWPTGPQPGVYITTSQGAIDALLDRYDVETDNALIYAEQAGRRKDGSIDLGDHGLWSSGLARVPSGTLLVVGPLQLNQQYWNDSADRLEIACLHALNSGHRVAVLLDTPTPETLAEDVLLMVRRQASDEDLDRALIGVVADDGEMQIREPFSRPRTLLSAAPTIATPDAIPRAARILMQRSLKRRQSGLLVLGSDVISEQRAADLVSSGLALTDHAGAAARIMPRQQSTPAKDCDLPEAIRRLPLLPSIESAYDQGFRRMVINPIYTRSELLLEFSKDVLFIAGVYACDALSALVATMRMSSHADDTQMLERVIAILGITHIPKQGGAIEVVDLYLGDETGPATSVTNDEGLYDRVTSRRPLKMENQLSELLHTGAIGIEDLKALERNSAVMAYLEELGEHEQM